MEAASPGFLYTLVMFLVTLSILVFVHEWGHYIVARIFGTRVEVFSIGFGKEIFGWNDKNDTRWKISVLPLGGYVKFYGDASVISNPEAALAKMPAKERARCFHFKPVWQRMLIVAAGPVINFIFAIFLFAGIYTAVGERVAEPVISIVTESSPAAEAGFLVGDRILEVNGTKVETFDEIIPIVTVRAGQEISFLVDRNSEILELFATPLVVEIKDPFGNTIPYGRLGITSTESFFKEHNVFTGLVAGTKRTWNVLALSVDTIGRVLTGNFSKEEFGGPIKIAQYTGYTASLGLLSYLSFMALISASLGFINILPIPMLDGGHLLFYSIEAVKGRPISVKAQELASMLGLAFVVGLLFVLTWNDLKLPGLS